MTEVVGLLPSGRGSGGGRAAEAPTAAKRVRLTAAVELTPAFEDDELEVTVMLRYDPAEAATELTIRAEAATPLTQYTLIILAPTAETASAGTFTKGRGMVFTSCMTALPGVHLANPVFQAPDDALFCALPGACSSSVAAGSASRPLPAGGGTTSREATTLPSDPNLARPKSVICTFSTDDTGAAELTRMTECLRLHGPPNTGANAIGRWFAVAEKGRNELVALGKCTAA